VVPNEPELEERDEIARGDFQMRSNGALLYMFHSSDGTLFWSSLNSLLPMMFVIEDKNHINEELTKFLLKWN